MRIPLHPVTGDSFENARLLANSGLAMRLTATGLPAAALILAAAFAVLALAAQDSVKRAHERNAGLRVQAMALVLERVFTEAHNQLRILSTGPVSRRAMMARLRLRAGADGIRYREMAFLARKEEDSFILLNLDDEIVVVPPEAARQAVGGPFSLGATRHAPHQAQVNGPLEVTYPALDGKDSVRSLTLKVLRLSTPIFENGEFSGILILSLDLAVLRDALSLFAREAGGTDAEDAAPGVFFDADGWMLFAFGPGIGPEAPLSVGAARRGFEGDFGRPGFGTAFRPSADDLPWWDMVAAMQAGGSTHADLGSGLGGHIPGRARLAGCAPIRFQVAPGESVIIGGIMAPVDADSGPEAVRPLWGAAALACLAAILLLGWRLWRTGRAAGRSMLLLAEAVERRVQGDPDPLEPIAAPEEVRRVHRAVGGLINRLRHAEQERSTWRSRQLSLRDREPSDSMPEEVAARHGLVGDSPVMAALREDIARAARTDADVLVIGETGTGKELVSRAIHAAGNRAGGPFVTINCGALDENLLMDTLFGHVPGAFSEAKKPRKGAFLAAEGGVLMLDEVGNASPRVQQALLRALSTRVMRPLGSDEEVPFDTRIIAATNADLTRGDEFRADLYYRLAVITVATTPLRDHAEDIPALAAHFLSAEAAARGMPMPALSRGAMRRLLSCPWPGNVRQLRNCLIRAFAFSENGIIQEENLQLDTPGAAESAPAEAVPAHRASGLPDGVHSAGTPAAAPAPPVPSAPSIPSAGGTAAREIPGETLGESPADGAADDADADGTAPAEDALAALPQRILDLLPRMAAAGSLSRQEYQDLAPDISMRTAQYDLQLLQRLNLAERRGRGPAQRYVLTPAGENLAAGRGGRA